MLRYPEHAACALIASAVQADAPDPPRRAGHGHPAPQGQNRYGGAMLRLTQAPNIAIATLWADLLCEAGMTASVQRQYLGAAAGHLPPDQCLPEIWLDHEEHAPRARTLLQALQDLPQRRWLKPALRRCRLDPRRGWRC